MKIDNPIFTVNVGSDEKSLESKLKLTLKTACKEFLINADVDTIQASQSLAIAHRIALSQYITGLKIQKFANSASINDTITLENEINLFIKEFNKVAK